MSDGMKQLICKISYLEDLLLREKDYRKQSDLQIQLRKLREQEQKFRFKES